MSNLGFSHKPAALLLDAGDTLLFLDCGVVQAALARLGLHVERTALERGVHPAKRAYQALLTQGGSHEDGWTVMVRAILTSAGLSMEDATRALPPLRAEHDDFYFWRRVADGLPEALEKALSGGIRLGVISNSEGRLESVLKRLGLASFFEHIIDSQLEGVSKPNPEIFQLALSRMGLNAAQCVYAGDIPEVDVLGARSAGMHGVVIDAYDDYANTAWPRVRSVAALTEQLLEMP